MNNYGQDKDPSIIRRFMPKLIISFFYLALLGTFLYFPRIFNYFQHGEKSLNIYSFIDLISPHALEIFHQQTGINVSITYFESNEELYTKLRITGGEGYDLIVVSDYMVELLKKENLLHTLDHDKLVHFDKIDTRLRSQFFDPRNNHSIPLAWTTYGLMFDRALLPEGQRSFSLGFIFNSPDKQWDVSKTLSKNLKLSMTNDAREAVCLAAIYLFGRVTDLTDNEYKQIKQLLIKQKEWVENYTNEGLQYLLMGNIVPAVYGPSVFMRNVLAYSDRFDFVIPEEGSLFVIENMVIPRASEKKELVYRLINFLTEPDIAYLSSAAYGYNPTNSDAYKKMSKTIYENRNYFPAQDQFKKLHLIHNELSLERIEDIWLAVKSA